MEFYVGVTDNARYRFLRSRPCLDEVNFRQLGKTPCGIQRRDQPGTTEERPEACRKLTGLLQRPPLGPCESENKPELDK